MSVRVCARVLLWLNCMSRTDSGDLQLQGATLIPGFITPPFISAHVTYSFSESFQTSNCISVPAISGDTARLQSSRPPSSEAGCSCQTH